jgi:ribosome-binding factor A
MAPDRPARVESVLQELISDLLVQGRIHDPRVHGRLTVTDVEVSKDLRHAKVFISYLGPPEDEAGVFEALEGAAGYVQSCIGRGIRLRYTPKVRFVADHSIERGVRLVNTINRLTAPAPPRDDGRTPPPA